MTTYSAVTAAQIDADSPLDTVLATQWTNNLLAVIEGDATAPSIAYLAMEDFTASSPAFTVAGLPAIISTTSTSYVKVKEIEIPKDGNYSISFDLAGDGTYAATGRIYVNGAATGTERNHGTSATYTTYTQTINSLSAGDLVQIYIKSSNVSGSITTRGFRLDTDQSAHFGPRVDYAP